jgi:tetratricopeptide (TPR) repeat protein
VIRTFLDGLGVPVERVPADPTAQVGLFRSWLAGKHLLIVLDNVRSADEARALLPGTPTALVLVTSREQLTSLVATHGARSINLGVLPAGEARELMAHRLGWPRVRAEPAAVDAIVASCAGLPLALAVAAARAQQTGFPLAAVAAELSDARQRLDALDGGDPTSQVRTVFSWSYRSLAPSAARLFRLLGAHAGADITTSAAASLAAQSQPATHGVLVELTRASLVTEHRPGRYTVHDLLRSYAAEMFDSQDPPTERAAALGRLLSHYLHTAQSADRLLNPHRDPIGMPLDRPATGTAPQTFDDRDQATAWLASEYRVLAAVLAHAADNGFDRHVCQLTWLLDTYLDRYGHWHILVSAWHSALAAAERLPDRAMQAYAYRRLGYIDTRLDRYQRAEAALQRALDLYLDLGDPAGQANVHHVLAYLKRRQGDQQEALRRARRAFTLFEEAGHERGQALALNAIGWYLSMLGEHAEALTCCQRALTLLERVDDPYGQAHAWDSLGFAQHRIGNHGAATASYRRAVAMFHELGERYYEAATLVRLGDARLAANHPGDSRTAWRRASAILTDLGHPEADAATAKLRSLGLSRTSR